MAFGFNEVYGNSGNNSLVANELDVVLGLAGDDIITGNATNQLWPGATYMFGGSGNDTYIASGSDTYIISEAIGYDVLVIPYDLSDDTFFNEYSVSFSIAGDVADYEVIIKDFFIKNTIEEFRFNNATLLKDQLVEVAQSSDNYNKFSEAVLDSYSLEQNVTSGFLDTISYYRTLEDSLDERYTFINQEKAIDIARLYQAGLGREPDQGGMNYWISAVESGVSERDLSFSFLESPEFTNRYGDDDGMSNSEFISVMYQNVLGRQAEQEGFDYWVNVMNQGLMDREQGLIVFAESPENQQQTAYLNSMDYADGQWFF